MGVAGERGGQGAGWTGAPLTPLGHCHYPPLTLPATGPLLPGHDLACHWPFLLRLWAPRVWRKPHLVSLSRGGQAQLAGGEGEGGEVQLLD